MNKTRYQAIYRSENRNWWYKGRRKLILQVMDSLQLKSGSKLLDVGSGTGRNLQLLNNFDGYGVDISPEAIKFCRERKINNVFLVKDNKYPFPEGFFDIVTCFDILEHVENEALILSEISRVVKKKGHLVVFAPSKNMPWGELDEDSHHYRRYSKDSLRKILVENGFSVLSIKYYNYILFLPIFAVRVFQKTPWGRNNKYGVRPDSESDLVNRMLEPIFTFDIRTVKYVSPPLGISVYAIAQKS